MKKKWFVRLRNAPGYFQVVSVLMLIDMLLSFFIYVPGLWERGLAGYGNLIWAPLLILTFLVAGDRPAAARILRALAIGLAVITSIQTVSRFVLCSSAHAKYPNNPSFLFTWFNWADGVVFPWIVVAVWLFTPTDRLPMPRQGERLGPTGA